MQPPSTPDPVQHPLLVTPGIRVPSVGVPNLEDLSTPEVCALQGGGVGGGSQQQQALRPCPPAVPYLTLENLPASSLCHKSGPAQEAAAESRSGSQSKGLPASTPRQKTGPAEGPRGAMSPGSDPLRVFMGLAACLQLWHQASGGRCEAGRAPGHQGAAGPVHSGSPTPEGGYPHLSGPPGETPCVSHSPTRHGSPRRTTPSGMKGSVICAPNGAR